MATRDREIALFSTSAIDLLSCGLAAMLVLWVLLLGNRAGGHTGDREVGSARFTITQFKLSHISKITVDPSFTTLVTSPLPPGIFPNPAVPAEVNVAIGRSWELIYERPSDGGRIQIKRSESGDFGVRVEVAYLALKRPAKVVFQLLPCNAPGEAHYLEVDSTDASGMHERWFGYHCESAFEKFVSDPPASSPPKWLKNFQTSLQTDPRMWKQAFRYEIVTDCKLPANVAVAFGEDGNLRASLPKGDVKVVRGAPVAVQLANWAGAPRSVTGL